MHRVCPFSGTARKWISPWKELGAVSASGGLETVLKPSRPVVLVQLHLLVVHITITTTILIIAIAFITVCRKGIKKVLKYCWS